MKITRLVVMVAVALSSWVRLEAGQVPTWTAWYEFWVSTTGRYPVEYFVDSHDNDGDLVRLYGQGYDESADYWYTCDRWGGNNWDQYMHGWGCSLDGYSVVRFAFQDTEGAIFWEGEAPEFEHEPAQFIRHW